MIFLKFQVSERGLTTRLQEAALIADIIVDFMKARSLSSIGGLEMGAVPIVAAVAAVSHLKNYSVSAFFVRKAQKEHGARERIDGYLAEGGEVLMIDDVATTGGSILKAIEGLREEGRSAHVRTALAIIDREEGAAGNLAKQDIKTRGDFQEKRFSGNLNTLRERAWWMRRHRQESLPLQNMIKNFFLISRPRAVTNGIAGGLGIQMSA